MYKRGPGNERETVVDLPTMEVTGAPWVCPTDETPAAMPDDDRVPRLLRQLVDEISKAPPLDVSLGADGEDTILDMAIDGARYVLIRAVLKPADAQMILSPRELEIARMVAEGHPNKAIAAVLEISTWTVCTHLRRIFAKLGVRTRAAMVARLHKEGAFAETLTLSSARNTRA